MRRRQGFTLIEMLIVIIIIVIVAGATVSMMGVFLRGQGVNRGGAIVTQAVAQAKGRAAETHKYHFLVFSKSGQQAGGQTISEGWMEVHRDMNNDGVYQGDQDPTTPDADPVVQGDTIQLPKFVVFEYAPEWIAFAPSGYIGFGGGFQEIQASSFDANMSGSNPSTVGDVILRIQNQEYYMCMDMDRASGKIRRFFFLNKSK